MLRWVIAGAALVCFSFPVYADASPKVGDKGTTVWEDRATYTVKILKVKGDRCYVKWAGWDSSHNAWRPCKDIRVAQKASAKVTYKPGQKGTTVWKDGNTYSLKILKVKGSRCYVTWPKWDASFNEWRKCSTIMVQQSGGSPIKVGDTGTMVWKDGNTYTLTVRKVKGSKCYVKYKGWDSAHNEWVSCKKIQR